MNKQRLFFGALAALAAFPLICMTLGIRQFFPGPPLIAFVAVPILVLAVEMAAVGWRRSSLGHAMRLEGSTRADILLTAAAVTGFAPAMVAIFSFGASYLVGLLTHSAIHRATGFNLHIDTGNAWANFGVYYLAYNFLEYWNHRLFHMGPLWHLHRFHHAATELTVFTGHRSHPAQHALEPLLLAWPLGLVSVSPVALAILMAVNQFYQLLVHTNVTWTWGWFGRWILISPAAHRLHHSTNPEHYGKNLSVLTIWDRLFGTWYAGNVPVTTLGVGGEYNSRGIVVDFLRDCRLFYSDILGRVTYPTQPSIH